MNTIHEFLVPAGFTTDYYGGGISFDGVYIGIPPIHNANSKSMLVRVQSIKGGIKITTRKLPKRGKKRGT